MAQSLFLWLHLPVLRLLWRAMRQMKSYQKLRRFIFLDWMITWCPPREASCLQICSKTPKWVLFSVMLFLFSLWEEEEKQQKNRRSWCCSLLLICFFFPKILILLVIFVCVDLWIVKRESSADVHSQPRACDSEEWRRSRITGVVSSISTWRNREIAARNKCSKLQYQP